MHAHSLTHFLSQAQVLYSAHTHTTVHTQRQREKVSRAAALRPLSTEAQLMPPHDQKQFLCHFVCLLLFVFRL